MAIIRWNPLSLNSMLSDDWELPTLPGLSRLGQGLNIYETDDSIVAEAALPGVSEDRIDVSIDNDVVTISGNQEVTQEDKSKRRYFMSNMSASYDYAFRLPQGIKDEEPRVELTDGVLTLTFPKIEKVPPKKLKVSMKSREKTDKSK